MFHKVILSTGGAFRQFRRMIRMFSWSVVAERRQMLNSWLQMLNSSPSRQKVAGYTRVYVQMEMVECHLYTFIDHSTRCLLRGASWSLWNTKLSRYLRSVKEAESAGQSEWQTCLLIKKKKNSHSQDNKYIPPSNFIHPTHTVLVLNTPNLPTTQPTQPTRPSYNPAYWYINIYTFILERSACRASVRSQRPRAVFLRFLRR